MESGKARRDTRAEGTSLYRFVLCGIAQNVAHLRFKAASMPCGPPLEARFYIVFQVTNDKLSHQDLAIIDIKISIIATIVNALVPLCFLFWLILARSAKPLSCRSRRPAHMLTLSCGYGSGMCHWNIPPPATTDTGRRGMPSSSRRPS